MYKISWGRASDLHVRAFILVPDVHTLFDAYWVITGYGRQDGMTPLEIRVTNLDGAEVDMTKGAAAAASMGTYSAS
jgi:hypothetical protein